MLYLIALLISLFVATTTNKPKRAKAGLMAGSHPRPSQLKGQTIPLYKKQKKPILGFSKRKAKLAKKIVKALSDKSLRPKYYLIPRANKKNIRVKLYFSKKSAKLAKAKLAENGINSRIKSFYPYRVNIPIKNLDNNILSFWPIIIMGQSTNSAYRKAYLKLKYSFRSYGWLKGYSLFKNLPKAPSNSFKVNNKLVYKLTKSVTGITQYKPKKESVNYMDKTINPYSIINVKNAPKITHKPFKFMDLSHNRIKLPDNHYKGYRADLAPFDSTSKANKNLNDYLKNNRFVETFNPKTKKWVLGLLLDNLHQVVNRRIAVIDYEGYIQQVNGPAIRPLSNSPNIDNNDLGKLYQWSLRHY